MSRSSQPSIKIDNFDPSVSIDLSTDKPGEGQQMPADAGGLTAESEERGGVDAFSFSLQTRSMALSWVASNVNSLANSRDPHIQIRNLILIFMDKYVMYNCASINGAKINITIITIISSCVAVELIYCIVKLINKLHHLAQSIVCIQLKYS